MADSATSVTSPGSLLGWRARRELPYVRRGSGVFLEAEDGVNYLDGSSGALAAALGHGRGDMAAVLSNQAMSVAFAHRTQLRNRATEELADLLAQRAPGDLSSSMFVSSGSDANELALALSIRYWHGEGHPERQHVLARGRSYHGATLGALSLTGLAERRAVMEPLLFEVPRLPSPGPDLDAEGESRLLAELETALCSVQPHHVAAVMIEAVSGTSGGAIVPPRSYTDRIQRFCRETGALLIVDEVMSGFGRTGRLFAFEHLGLEPDVVTFGKGVSGGYCPLGGVIVTTAVAERLDELGGVGLGHTYMNTPLPSAVGLAACRIILAEQFLSSVHARGEELRTQLRLLRERHSERISSVRGVGLMNAVEIVARPDDRQSSAGLLLGAMRDAGLLLYPATSHVPGSSTTHVVMVAPPLVITAEEVNELVRRFDRGLTRYFE
ncbi:aspartate aminotransferase family protein [Ruicaihuangia caeni]|uniref:Aminotransferase class III-fold pyridoxal phosphate-dependent enzyme n=1 Tax=Ruicaihuangia caeni TaxID=3042517 RepID=A0AAW6T9B3_9MICO|nr:aminotransferase class III-fold pyridoxal phosphate-dependent enzyme [Klugiella sp. YN-L-19]MDI2098650.1 aminotransferase class III-fold pyridoxal phosphate-dependent enzyme [Klugiella sp. YN-L-19]